MTWAARRVAPDVTVSLSVLDTAPLSAGQTSGDALAATTRLARAADDLGYRRFWVAEHHAMPMVASTAPGVFAAHLLAATRRIRVGSGGVMLPNHPALVVAEQFAMLEALHPGRVDLGLGRAPGADPATAAALRRTVDGLGADDFPTELVDVLALLGVRLAAAPSAGARRLTATPVATSSPEPWLLGSSLFSAQLAGELGLPYSYAHHFSTGRTTQAAETYRRAFRPSPVLDAPRLMVSASVLVADTEQEARHLAGPSRVMTLALRTGRPLAPVLTPDDAARALADLDPRAAEDFFAQSPGTQVATTPDRAVAELSALVERTGADELMVTGTAFDVADRVRTLHALADRWPGTTAAA
ncbi:LLM class flavin-dependent oxidoreductase [Cellulomonas fimi]|uniref:Luciferase family oxidoreductase, group 1 n=1 Tax=Cellulomonas fimi (strain ATCC 484 / DSM 20113 / JCM 1341 / CCUG 24087 / LMG 16345 / NBRC 15513 / NCIMB 8980 / NCTC 7547 / NRS-133) TaxID=590998 RepID=F4H466_CELFA|nr:luciferase family oxidoreductase, group 1 [Cellulomonas fimi ATCC 484]NNH06829.1 LLM class flavin-dependent oxidoreductase [Cellulomonas fimi]VEH29331.1 Limonene 1,2-monooxygenase [Cellulomonas fimi]